RAPLAGGDARLDLGRQAIEQVLGDAPSVEDPGAGGGLGHAVGGSLRYSRNTGLSPITPADRTPSSSQGGTGMAIQGQCGKCGHRVLHVNVEEIFGVVDGDSKARIL